VARNQKFKIASFFAGCGGLDLGFKQAGFDIVWANDFDKTVLETHQKNFPKTSLDTRSIVKINSAEIPGDVHGIIGGPPCQSWSLAGAMRGVNDHRGQVFYDYIRILKDKKPLFFLAENVPGLISKTHLPEFIKLLSEFKKIGYDVDWTTLNAKDYGVSQERKRVFILGYKKELGLKVEFPKPTHGEPAPLFAKSKKSNLKPYVTLKELIGNMQKAIPAKERNKPNVNGELLVPNHEYMIGSFSTIFMSRNRKKEWDDVSYTIQAGGRHAPLHPSAIKMTKVEKDLWMFDAKTEHLYRRLSVRECARIQSFPDDFIFYYDAVANGYKMVGNAVPVLLAKAIALNIKKQLKRAGSQFKN
jgi:DNA (cytosine-5)-methyltransferase 1